MCGKASPRYKRLRYTSHCDLVFPINSIHKLLRDGNHAEQVAKGAAVYLAAVMEYLAMEILFLAGNASGHKVRTRILSRHLESAIFNDVELSKLLSGVTFAQDND